MPTTDLAGEVERVFRHSRLAENVLLAATVARVAAEHAGDGRGEPLAAVTWTKPSPPGGALIAGRTYHGREGQIELLPAGAAAVLADSGYVVAFEALQLPAAQRPEVAAELAQLAGQLLEAARELDPAAQPQAPDPEPAEPREDV